MKYAVVFLISLSLLAASKKPRKPEPQDAIAVVGHVRLGDAAVHITSAVHWRKTYLYIEQAKQGVVKVVEVTDPAAPKVVGEFVPPADGGPLHMGEVEGTAALFTASPPRPAETAPGAVVIMSYADPANPKVERRFNHVTAMLRSEDRLVTYLVDDEGLWILRHLPAPDRALQDWYQHEIIYNH